MEQQGELPRLSKNANSRIIETSSKRSILMFKVLSLNLYVISDCNNFGSNWIEVKFSNKIYSTNYLMGENEDLFSVIARRFAQDILESTSKPLEDDELQNLAPRTIMLNIALKNPDPSEIRDISVHLRNF